MAHPHTIPTAWLRRREPPTPAPITPCFPTRSGGQHSRGRARSLGGGIDRAAPPAPCPPPGAHCPASPARRPPLRRRHAGWNLLVATLGDWRAPCSARRPCSKPCSPGWAEIEQEWIPWCTMNLTLSRSAPLSPSAFCIDSFIGLATPVKFDRGAVPIQKGMA